MKKCECYHIREKTFYDPYTESQKCIKIEGECWGTPKKDICYCKGDKCKCDCYPEIKQKALKEKQREQKDKNLKHIKKALEFYLDSHEKSGVVYIPKFVVENMIKELR